LHDKQQTASELYTQSTNFAVATMKNKFLLALKYMARKVVSWF